MLLNVCIVLLYVFVYIGIYILTISQFHLNKQSMEKIQVTEKIMLDAFDE